MPDRIAVGARRSASRRFRSTIGISITPAISRIAALILLSCAWAPIARAAGTFYVDNTDPGCSDSGVGSITQPYCTIGKAVTARGGAGTTILVKAGVYREIVTPAASGSSSSPFVIRALSSAVTVDGADDFSGVAKWKLLSGNVWLASTVTATPKQVIVDGVRLAVSTSSAASIPVNSFRYVSGTGLYVNAGGGNPGARATFVGKRANGFKLSSRTWVMIDGFTIARSEDRGIVATGSGNCSLLNNTVSLPFTFGIHVTSGSGYTFASNTVLDGQDHGFYLSGVSASTLRDNVSSRLRKPGGTASGFYLTGSSTNRLERNRASLDSGSGFSFQSSSKNNVCVQNRSWDNSEYGYLHTSSTGTRHVGDVATRNAKGGFVIQSSSTASGLADCIAVENAGSSAAFDLLIDSGSTSGFVSNYNLFWNSGTLPPVKYGSTSYATVAAYATATAKDAQSLQFDPRFVNAAGGDFHLASGSRAIDSGNSSVTDWPATDADGRTRLDDLNVANTGIGSVTYADRGAFEYVPVNLAPTAVLTATPAQGFAPLTVSLNASGSIDPEGVPMSYRFDFGDGSPAVTQSTALVSHVYAVGHWTATITVADAGGLTATSTAAVTANAVNQAPIVQLVATPAAGLAPLTATLDARGSRDPEGGSVSYTFVFGDGASVGPQASPLAPHTYAAGRWTARLTVLDSVGATATTTVVVAVNASPVAALSASPVSGVAPLTALLDASASRDPENGTLSYRFDFGDGTTVGPQAASKATHVYARGRWTARVTVTDSVGATASATAAIGVNGPPTAALTATPASGFAPLSVQLNASASSDPEAAPLSFRFDFGDGASAGPQASAIAQHAYAAGSWTARVTVTDSASATASTQAVVVVAAVNAPPTVTLAAQPPSGLAPLAVTLDASSARDPEGGRLSYAFDFGDGASAGPLTVASATHSYAAGNWTARVTVTDSVGATASATKAIAVTVPNQAPTAALAVSPATGVAPLVASADASGSRDPEGGRLTYRFTFGDGATAGPQSSALASHSYAAGHFTLAVTVTDSVGATATASRDVVVNRAPNQPPTALLRFNPTSGTAPFDVILDASLSRDLDGVMTYRFDFGDGTSAGPQSAPTIHHTYAAGNWTARVTVTDDSSATATATAALAVNAPPTADLRLTPSHGSAPLTVTADLSLSRDPEGGRLTYWFDFGDGSPLAGPFTQCLVTHTYPLGDYLLTAIVVDSVGGPAVASASVTASRAPLPVLSVMPGTGVAPLTVTADARGSTDPDGRSLRYQFDFGDGTIVGPQSNPVMTHVYVPGVWIVRCNVINSIDASATATAAVHAKGRPVAVLVATPSFGDPPLTAMLDASGSTDPEHGALSYRFDFGDGGTTAAQSIAAVNHVYAIGRWTATVTVTDPDGLQSTATTIVTVNAPPTAALSATPSAGVAPLTVSLDASGSHDPEGAALVYQFDFGDGSGVGPQAAATASHAYAAGTWTARVTVTDPQGASATATRGVTANAPPVAVLNVAPTAGVEPLAVTLDASGSHDPEGQSMTYTFDFGDGATQGPQALPTASHAYARGHWRARVTVIDALGAAAVAIASGDVVVAPPFNTPPVARLAVTPTHGDAPLAVHADASGSSDANGVVVSYRFDFGDGTTVGPQGGSAADHVYAAGRWLAKVRVVDDSSTTACDSLWIDVNAPPLARLDASPTGGVAPLAVALDASASSDPDGGVLAYTFAFGDGATAGPQPQANASHVYAPGHWTAVVSVRDDHGSVNTASRAIDVRALPIALLTVTPRAGTAPLACVIDASQSRDPDGEALTYAFDFGDGTSAGPQSGATATHTFAPGVWRVAVTVTDNDPGAATDTVTVAVNAPPVAALKVDPGSGMGPLEVTADATDSSDPDGVTRAYTFAFGDGAVIGPQPEALAKHVLPPGVWTVRVRVMDAAGASDSASLVVNVARPPNRPPVAALAAQPASGAAPLAVTLDASATTDPDGGPFVYRFDFGDGESSGDLLAPHASHVYATGTWTATVTVTDDSAATSVASAVIRVNQPPVAALVMTPASGEAPLAVVADASASSDPESTPLTYRFDFGDGVIVGPQSAPTAAHTYLAGTWTAHVTVTDELGAATIATATVTVRNHLPIAALAAAPSSGNAPLAVAFDASGSRDPDGAIRTYAFDFGDGTAPVTGTDPHATHVYAQGRWTARVTVTDDSAATARDSVTVAANGAPVAALTLSPAGGVAPLTVSVDASASHDPDGDALSYFFDFGDGTTRGPQPGAVASHDYPAGTYRVRITVSDPSGLSAGVFADLAVNGRPTVLLSAAPTSGTGSLQVAFDATGSHDPEGAALRYVFDFGDGATAGPQMSPLASHLYGPGAFTASVTAIDAGGATATATATISVNAIPIAALSASPSTGTSPLDVTLDASASHDPDGTALVYRFDFGDGTFAGPESSPTALHRYGPGGFTATVTVTDPLGATATATALVTADNHPPTAALTASPLSGTAPLAVSFDASGSSDADGHVATYLFDFGDGTHAGPQAAATASHTYGYGHRTARVTVTDDRGATAFVETTLDVNARPLAALLATPASGYQPLDGVLDASGSRDADDAGLTYAFNFGDGTSTGPQSQPTAPHTWALGTWNASVTVTDPHGAAATASVTVSSLNQPPVAVLAIRRGTLEPDSGFVPLVTDPAPAFTIPSVPRPAYLATVNDSVFRTKVQRITDLNGIAFTTATGLGSWGADARHHYSKDQPWNSDGTLIAEQNSVNPHQLFLDGSTYHPMYGECSSYNRGDDRWHPSAAHPHERINAKGAELMWYDIVTCTKTRSWTLPFPVLGIGDGEGNPSLDGRFVALCDSSRMFVVDMDPQAPFAAYPAPRIGPVYNFLAGCTLPECRLGWVGVSPSGKFVVCKFGGDYVQVFDLDPNTLELTPRPMAASTPHCDGDPANGFIYDLGHCDMALNPFDHNEDVIIGQEHCGKRGQVVDGKLMGAVVMARLRDGAITPLTDPTNEAQAHHISCQNVDRPGWAYVGYYPQAGKRFSDEIVAVKMDGSKAVQRLAHKHSDTSNDCYRCEAHAVPSRDGRRVVWASNWAIDCTTCGAKSELKDYVLDARVNPAPDTGWVAPVTVTMDASGAVDLDGTVVSYAFNFGDGASAGPQAASTAFHTYAAGNWVLKLTVTDDRGGTDTTSAVIHVAAPAPPPDNAPVVTAPAAVSGNESEVLTLHVTASDPDNQAITSLTADLSALPAGNNAVFTAASDKKSGTLTWTPANADTGRTFRVRFTAANALSGGANTDISVTFFNQPPVVALNVSPTQGPAPMLVTANATGSSDPDGSVSRYLFEFGDGTVVGPQTAAIASHTYAVGTWTLRVTAYDNENGAASATTTVQALQNLVGNPSFEVSTNGWNVNGAQSITRVAGGFDGNWCLEMKSPSSTASFGVNDSPNWALTVSSPGVHYRVTAWVRSASNVGTAKIRIREYLNSVQQGPTNYSTGVLLSPTWKLVTYDYVTLVAGSTLDLQIVDFAVVNSETFQTDLVTMVIVPAQGSLVAASLEDDAGAVPATDPALNAAPSPPLRFGARLFPNPPRREATLSFATTRAGRVRIGIYDIGGRLVRGPLADGDLPAGRHEVRFNTREGASRMAAGVYFYRIEAAEGMLTGRFVVVD